MNTTEMPPFAITARTFGHPSKLYTPILVANLRELKVVRVNAMWDTGSPWCMMSEKLSELLRLNFMQNNVLRGISGSGNAECGFTHVSLVAGGGLISVETAVVKDFIGEEQYSFIIGLNLIRHGTFALTSNAVETILTFKIPSTLPAIDFVADSTGQAGAYLPLSGGSAHIEEFNAYETVRLLKSLYPRRQPGQG